MKKTLYVSTLILGLCATGVVNAQNRYYNVPQQRYYSPLVQQWQPSPQVYNVPQPQPYYFQPNAGATPVYPQQYPQLRYYSPPVYNMPQQMYYPWSSYNVPQPQPYYFQPNAGPTQVYPWR